MSTERESSTEWQDASNATSDDDDMEFQESTPQLYGIGEDEEGNTTLYFDAEENTIYVPQDDEDEAEAEDDGGEDAAESAEDGTSPQQAQPTRHQMQITQAQMLRLLQAAGIQGLFSSGIVTRSQSRGVQLQSLPDDDEEEVREEVEDDEDDDVATHWWGGRRRRRRTRHFSGDRYPKVPSEEGIKLMNSGTFGLSDRCDHTACGLPFTADVQNKRRRLSRRIMDRELGLGSYGRARALSSLTTHDLVPGTKADMIVNMDARCYSGQFSEDGSFFFACGQDFRVRMYDTSNPYDWKYYKTVNYIGGQWTITDATLSPDNKLLAYSSIRSQVCLARTDPHESSDPHILHFNDPSARSRGFHDNGHFGIWSVRFSGDGSEIVAGTSSDSVFVYDLEAQRSILRIPGHTDDVNAVCFGDKMSPHILYSGSDDTTLKVWDRRSLNSLRPAGMFLGHTEGITYIDSLGDGRHVISNAKDQTCKLWDLRKMVSTEEGEKLNPAVS